MICNFYFVKKTAFHRLIPCFIEKLVSSELRNVFSSTFTFNLISKPTKMKKIYLLFLAIGITACSADSLETINSEAGETANLNGKKQATTAAVEKFNVPEQICAGVAAEFSLEAEIGTNLQVQQYDEILDEWFQVFQEAQSDSNPESFWLTFDAAGEYQLRYKIGGGGFTETTIVVENCGCEESFNYIMNEDGSYTFTYIPGEDMTSAELVFTFAQASAVGLDNSWTHNGNGNSQTWKTRMDLTACTEYSWTVFLDANCSGNSGHSNLWTDFTVNEDSKKGDLTNIVKTCD